MRLRVAALLFGITAAAIAAAVLAYLGGGR